MYIYVFSITHPTYGKQYVARVYTSGVIETEIVFNSKPAQQEIIKKLLEKELITIGYQEEWIGG